MWTVRLRVNRATAGIGGVLRDSEGKILCFFCSFIGTHDSNVAEIMAIHKACELCASKPSLIGRNIIVAGES